jgi:hypothetical protein
MKINKSSKIASSLGRRISFHLNRGKGHLGPYLWNRVRWHVYPRLGMAGSFPDHVDIELSSVCNMKCPMCYTRTEVFKKSVWQGFMDFGFFCKIIDQLSVNRVYSIRLSWRGEPTLNPRFLDCVRYAREKGIKEIASLTNALRLTPDMFEALVDLQMDWLTISFDGVGEAYEKIRNPAKFDEMVAKIRAFAEIKERKRSIKPVVRLQGVWPAIAENPEAYFELFEPLVDEVSVNSLLDFLHHDDEVEYIENFTCPVPFHRLVIGSDGRAFMCISDEYGREPIGDAKQQSIHEIWNGPKMRHVRRLHKSQKGVEVLEPCKVCFEPRKTMEVRYQVGERTICLDDLVGRAQVIGK